MAKLPRISGAEMMRFLEHEGFQIARVRGSHHYMEEGRRRTSVPVNGSRDLKVGTLRSTLRSILRDIERSPTEFGQKLAGK